MEDIPMKVLFVEDDDDVRTVISDGLRYLGVDVQAVPTAEKALLKLKFEKPNIILLDMNLPGLSGWDLTRKLRQGAYQDIPIVAFSGTARMGDEQKALAIGCAGFIAKPCDPPDVKRKLEEIRVKSRKF